MAHLRELATDLSDRALRDLCLAVQPLLWRDTQRNLVGNCLARRGVITAAQGRVLLALSWEVICEYQRREARTHATARVRGMIRDHAQALARGVPDLRREAVEAAAHGHARARELRRSMEARL